MQGDINVQLPIDKGVAGSCASTGQIINLKDAYQDERFDRTIDEKTKYHTRNILCVPMKSFEDKVIGVLQLINKSSDEYFQSRDESFCEIILSGAALTVKEFRSFISSNGGNEVDEKYVRSVNSSSHTDDILPAVNEDMENEDASLE